MQLSPRLNLRHILGGITQPASAVLDGIESIRIKSITLKEMYGSAIRLTIDTPENSTIADAAIFMNEAFPYQAALKSFEIIAASIAIHYHPTEIDQLGVVHTINLFSKGATNLDSIDEPYRVRIEGYLREWKIGTQTPPSDGEVSLYFLSKKLEAMNKLVLPYLLEEDERNEVNALRAAKLLCGASKQFLINENCPKCNEDSFTPRTLTCRHCGKLDVNRQDVVVLEPDILNLFLKIRMALGIPQGCPISLDADKKIWLLGEVGKAGVRKKVLFASNLGQGGVMSNLLVNWTTHIGSLATIIITTSNIDDVPLILPGVVVPPQRFSFREQFSLKNDRLKVGSALLEAVSPPVAGTVIPEYGPFTKNFTYVFIQDEPTPIKLTGHRSAIFRLLWEAQGQRLQVNTMMEKIFSDAPWKDGSPPWDGKEMSEVFQVNTKNGKEAKRALGIYARRDGNEYYLTEQALNYR